MTPSSLSRIDAACPLPGNVIRMPLPAAPYVRYIDRPMSWRTRLMGMGSTAGVALVLLGCVAFTWHVYAPPAPPVAVSAFNVEPPASPPEPVHDVPPGPQKVQKDKPQPIAAAIEQPKIEIPSLNPMPVAAAKPVPDPGPPVKETTAPESKPAPPAPQVSTGKPTWEGLVLGALNKAKRYPRDAHFARQQGVPYIHFTMDRQGKVLSVRLERASGVASLDQEALALPKRAQPLPKPPEEVKGDIIDLVVPVEFFMR